MRLFPTRPVRPTSLRPTSLRPTSLRPTPVRLALGLSLAGTLATILAAPGWGQDAATTTTGTTTGSTTGSTTGTTAGTTAGTTTGTTTGGTTGTTATGPLLGTLPAARQAATGTPATDGTADEADTGDDTQDDTATGPGMADYPLGETVDGMAFDSTAADIAAGRASWQAATASRETPVQRARSLAGAAPTVRAAGRARPAAGRQPRLSFGLTQSLRSVENLDLDPESRGRTTLAETDMVLRWREYQGLNSFRLDFGTTLRGSDGPATTSDGLRDPFVAFGWERSNGSARIGLDLRYAKVDQSSLSYRSVDVTDPDPEAYDVTGTRTQRSAGLSLGFGLDGPLATSLGYTASQTDYSGDTTRDGSRTDTASLGFNARLAPALTGSLGFGYQVYESDTPGEDTTRTPTVNLGLTRDRPAGALTANLGYEDRDEGQLVNLTFGGLEERAHGSVSWQLGASDFDGETNLIGALGWSRDLPTGTVSLEATRAVRTSDQNESRLVTAFSFDYRHALTQVDSLGLGLGYTESESVGSDDSSANGSLRMSWNRELTQDWTLSTGYEYRRREETGVEDADSNSLFLTIGRDFVLLR
ncbi:hypothetical protein [Frigidibacter sp. MR17.24]|uniref:hypothetical protein n=1 Tax=Frigidibacter sp. MR17.24 TaxID=3127345 RepID=UPI003012CA46